jgi:hypothetical protein
VSLVATRKQIARIGKCRRPAPVDQLGVPAAVIDMQVGAEHEIDLSRPRDDWNAGRPGSFASGQCIARSGEFQEHDADAGAARGHLFDDSRTLERLIGRPTQKIEEAVKGALATK